MGADIFHLICQVGDPKILVSLFGFLLYFFLSCSSSGMHPWRRIYNLREQSTEVDKMDLNKLYCITSQRTVQAHAPKAVAKKAGSQIHFSSEFPSWERICAEISFDTFCTELNILCLTHLN